MSVPPVPERADISVVLANMSDHLKDLADDVAQIAGAVSDVTTNASDTPSANAIQNLQKIDALMQSLNDLSTLCNVMSAPNSELEAASCNLKLATTKALLMPDSMQNSAIVGAVDLF